MNGTLDKIARELILEGLDKLPKSWQVKFKLMYCSPKLQLQKRIDIDIREVVAKMDSDKLDWALSQVEASLKKQKNTLNE